MSAINKNIKKIRTVKKISQQAFADLFSITRASVGSYEEGRAEPKIGLAMEIANKFGISVDGLLNKELTINEISGFSKHETPLPAGQKLNPDGSRHLIPYVSKKNCSTYLNNLDSRDYLGHMPRFEVPNFQHNRARAFEIVGNDMWHSQSGLFPGDTLVCIEVDSQKPQLLNELAIHAFVFEDKILIRRMRFVKDGLLLIANNPFYADVLVALEDIKELWVAHTLISNVNNEGGINHQSANTIRDLEKRIADLERRLDK